MTPEEILKQQAAIARAARVEKLHPVSPNPDACISGYDADLGQDIIQLSDGSIRYADSDTNGSVGVGDPILLHQGTGATHIDDLPHISTSPNIVKPKVLATDSLKILFSVISDGIHSFYIGGDRPVPQLIFEIDTAIYNPSNYNFGFEEPESEAYRIHGYLSNLGAKKNDWVVGIKYSKWDDQLYEYGDDVEFLSIIRPQRANLQIPVDSYTDNLEGITYPSNVDVVTYSDYETTGIGLLRWRGAGLWISDLQNLLASRYYWWESALEDFQTEKIFEDGQTLGSERVRTVTPPEWEFNSNFIPPWSVIASYNYNKLDHEGIKNLHNFSLFQTSEVWTRETNNPPNYYYSPPANSYLTGSSPNISSSLGESTLIAPAAPYSWSSYTSGSYTEFFIGAGILQSSFSGFGSTGSSLSRYESGYYSFLGSRKYLLIDTKTLLVEPSNYTFEMTEGSYAGWRRREQDYQNWTRRPEIYDVYGTNYLLKNASIGLATSKKSNNYKQIIHKLNGQEIIVESPTPTRYEQTYAETTLADTKLQSCLFKKITVDSTDDVHLQEPTTTTYYIYHQPSNTEYQIQGDLEINPRFSSFVKKGGGALIALDQIPENIKTGNAIVDFTVTKFTITGDTAEVLGGNPSAPNTSISIGSSTTMRQKINSLNINTNLQHCIENISYFS